jgi:hypothetical protein
MVANAASNASFTSLSVAGRLAASSERPAAAANGEMMRLSAKAWTVPMKRLG